MTALTDRIEELIPDARKRREVAGDKEVLVYGPPGTGKTRTLGVLLDAHIKAGLEPDRMLVNAFTRNATWELKRRLSTEYGLSERELPWVRTIHSSCFRLLGLRSEQVMTHWRLKEFGEDCGYAFKGVLIQRTVEDPYAVGSIQTFGDWCCVMEELRRGLLMDVPGVVRLMERKQPNLEKHWDENEALIFAHTYVRWKREKGLLDFSDMLETVLQQGLRPDVNWCWLDEAQDMSPLQWAVADLWARSAEELFVMADDDQTIFSFAGARPELLWKRPGHQFVLSHSYRLPSAVHGEALRIIERVEDPGRVPKDFEPHTQGGMVTRDYSLPSGLEELNGESWLVLLRNRAFADPFRGALMSKAIPFYDRTSSAGVPGQNSPRGRALAALLPLHQARPVRGGQLRALVPQLRSESLWPKDLINFMRSYSITNLEEAGASPELAHLIAREPLDLIRMEPHERRYLEQVLRKHGPKAILQPPKVELSTIHGVKGEEADNVVVSTGMAKQTALEYWNFRVRDPEHRVFYVAATRARKALYWISTGDRRDYDLP